MQLSLITLTQVTIMFLLIALGYVCYKTRLVNRAGSTQFTNILLYLVTPAVILNAYQTPFDRELAQNLLIAFSLGIASHMISLAIAYLLVRKKGEGGRRAIERYAVSYSNCGFMALPLVDALFGAQGVFFASAYMIVFQIFSWTQGYVMLSGKLDKKTLRKAFLSPVILAVAVGLILFFSRITLPEVLASTLSHTASLNTPLAMLVIGIHLARSGLSSAFREARGYYIVFLKSILIPLAAMAVYFALPLPRDIVLINLVSTACPCAAATLLFAEKFKLDTTHASNLITLSNIVSIVTIPGIVFLFQWLVR